MPQQRSRVIVGAAVLAAVAVLGYYTYRQSSYAEGPQPPAASSDAGGRSAPADAGLLDAGAAAGDPKSASADEGAGLTGSAASPVGAPPAEPLRQTRAARQPVKSQEEKGSEAGPFRPEACTEAAAALGLCAMKSVQKKEAAAFEAAIKRPQASGAGNAGAQEPPHPQTCTEGVAALGLCTARPTQRRE